MNRLWITLTLPLRHLYYGEDFMVISQAIIEGERLVFVKYRCSLKTMLCALNLSDAALNITFLFWYWWSYFMWIANRLLHTSTSTSSSPFEWDQVKGQNQSLYRKGFCNSFDNVHPVIKGWHDLILLWFQHRDFLHIFNTAGIVLSVTYTCDGGRKAYTASCQHRFHWGLRHRHKLHCKFCWFNISLCVVDNVF